VCRHESLICGAKLTFFTDFVIPDAEFEALNQLDRNERYNYPFRWGVDVFNELGAAEAERRAEEHAAQLRVSA
jgi:L-glyceraldehyde reductase